MEWTGVLSIYFPVNFQIIWYISTSNGRRWVNGCKIYQLVRKYMDVDTHKRLLSITLRQISHCGRITVSPNQPMRHAVPLGLFILTWQPFVVPTPLLLHNRKLQIPISGFYLTQLNLDSTIIRTLGEHANHFTTMAPLCIRRFIGFVFQLAFRTKIIIHSNFD
jgi:hypothetical protein